MRCVLDGQRRRDTNSTRGETKSPAYLRLAVSSLRAQREKSQSTFATQGRVERAEPASKGDTIIKCQRSSRLRFHARKRDTPEDKDQWVRVRPWDELIEKRLVMFSERRT